MMNQDFDPTQLTEKELLIQINTQLGHIRQLLMQLDTSDSSVDTQEQTQEPEPLFECRMCGAEVTESERKTHASSHGLPDSAQVGPEFRPINNPQ